MSNMNLVNEFVRDITFAFIKTASNRQQEDVGKNNMEIQLS